MMEQKKDVSDITFATKPDFSDVQEWKKMSVKKIQEQVAFIMVSILLYTVKKFKNEFIK